MGEPDEIEGLDTVVAHFPQGGMLIMSAMALNGTADSRFSAAVHPTWSAIVRAACSVRCGAVRCGAAATNGAATPADPTEAGNTSVLVHNCNSDSGLYFFKEKQSVLGYVGQTNKTGRRLGKHERSGECDPDDHVMCIHVCGGKHDREAVEAEIIDLLGGKGNLANKVYSLGLGRKEP